MTDRFWLFAAGETHSFTVTNIGNLATTTLSVSTSMGDGFIKPGGGWGAFNETCAGAVLAPGGSCGFDVTFDPSAPGVVYCDSQAYFIVEQLPTTVPRVAALGLFSGTCPPPA